jgi:hypothetical protein
VALCECLLLGDRVCALSRFAPFSVCPSITDARRLSLLGDGRRTGGELLGVAGNRGASDHVFATVPPRDLRGTASWTDRVQQMRRDAARQKALDRHGLGRCRRPAPSRGMVSHPVVKSNLQSPLSEVELNGYFNPRGRQNGQAS